MKRVFLLLSILVISCSGEKTFAKSQNHKKKSETKKICNITNGICKSEKIVCRENFDWMKDLFEKNDAGFQYVIDKKGKEKYLQHNKRFEKIVNSIDEVDQCILTLRDWLTYFRSSHYSINKNSFNKKFIDVDIKKFENILKAKKR